MTEPRRPKLQFQIRRFGHVSIPPGHLGSDYELLQERLARSWERVANIEFTRLLSRIRGNPVYSERKGGSSTFARTFYTMLYLDELPKG